ncbi:hypothetical protein [Pollutibacter soli]|uniref:hypothetical protein n=1 Tax=Pollutibacter soli TaxID=3034157 RepID=UPI00301398C7
MILKIVIATAATIIVLSCDKEAQETNPEKLLTQEAWILFAAGYDYNQNGVIDQNENILDFCQQDNRYHFLKNGTGTIAEGIHLCDPATHHTFNWKFENAESEIIINYQPFSISKLNNERLQLITKAPPLNSVFFTEYKH